MKKLCLSLLSSLLFVIAEAQQAIPKGAVMLGGDLGFASTKNTVNSNSKTAKNQYLSLSFAKAVKPNAFLGGFISLSGSTQPSFNPNYKPSKYQSIGGGVFARRYKPISKNFYLYLQNTLAINTMKNTSNSSVGSNIYVDTDKGMNLHYSFTPGISYRLNKYLHLESGFRDIAGLSFAKSEITSTQPSFQKTQSESVRFFSTLDNASSQFYLGFRLLFEDGKIKFK